MDIEEAREYCLSLPLTSEHFPFDENVLAFRVIDKIFAMVDLTDPKWFALKCDPNYALELRDKHWEITGAFHMNKKYWNQIDLFGELSDELVKGLIRHSYAEVVKKMTKKIRTEHPELSKVS
ncbi:MAG: MmcQ/YjbR family DNA-binding protein [Bacteroidaceae bacterium]|nr:MmcQ/YjbR family DNA-binding protein [Bacteroidaceae bacterium]